MPEQPAFPGLHHSMKKKQTRREKFLAEMDVVVPWPRLLALIEPHFPKVGPKGGRPPMPIETMLRVHFLQQWYALGDPMAEALLLRHTDYFTAHMASLPKFFFCAACHLGERKAIEPDQVRFWSNTSQLKNKTVERNQLLCPASQPFDSHAV